jgi:hypothetical protein
LETDQEGSLLKGHLLIVGENLQTLVALCIALSRCFTTTTLTQTSDVVGRTTVDRRRPFDAVVVVLDGLEQPRLGLVAEDGRTMFVASEPKSKAYSELRERGTVIVDLNESSFLLQVNLFLLMARKEQTLNR